MCSRMAETKSPPIAQTRSDTTNTKTTFSREVGYFATWGTWGRTNVSKYRFFLTASMRALSSDHEPKPLRHGFRIFTPV